MTKNFKKLFIVLPALVLMCLLCLSSCGKTVNMKKCVKVEYSPNYDGYATATVTLDTEAIDKLTNKAKILSVIKKALKSSEMYPSSEVDEMIKELKKNEDSIPKLSHFITYSVEGENTNLSNGDEVVVKVGLDQDFLEMYDNNEKKAARALGVSLKNTEVKIKVSGLEEFSTVKIDMKKLIKVDFGKYNGYANPTAELNSEYIKSLVVSPALEAYKGTLNYDAKSILSNSADCWVKPVVISEGNLSNGDKFKVKLDVVSGLSGNNITIEQLSAGTKIDFANAEIEYTVSGLQEPKNVIDLFEDIDKFLQYEGANGTGNARIDIPDNYSRQVGDIFFSRANYYYNAVKVIYKNKNIGEIYYSLDGISEYNYDLSKDDVFNVKVGSNDSAFSELEKLGYCIPTQNKQITVPDLGEYLTSKEQLTPQVIESIKARMCELSGAESINKIYFGTYKPGVECEYNSSSFIKAIYYKKGWFGGYYSGGLFDVIIKPDGTISEEKNETGHWGEDTIEDIVKELSESKYYNFEEIN